MELEAKIRLESDLANVIIHSIPGSFYHPMIFGTPSGHSSKNFRDCLFKNYDSNLVMLFFEHKISEIFRTMSGGGIKNHRMTKTPRN